MITLKKRSDFLYIKNHGVYSVTPAFIVQADYPKVPTSVLRYGLIATKKLGNAVIRNRARRRLRALIRTTSTKNIVGVDLVFIARTEILTRSFEDMKNDLQDGIQKIYARLQ